MSDPFSLSITTNKDKEAEVPLKPHFFTFKGHHNEKTTEFLHPFLGQ